MLRQHGVRWTPTQRATAYHEAGHAIACWVFRWPFEVSLDPIDDGDPGCRHPHPDFLNFETAKEQRLNRRQAVIIALAGMEAQRLVDAKPKPFHDQQDIENATELLELMGEVPRFGDGSDVPRRLARYRTESRALLSERRVELEQLAVALWERRKLADTHIDELIGLPT